MMRPSLLVLVCLVVGLMHVTLHAHSHPLYKRQTVDDGNTQMASSVITIVEETVPLIPQGIITANAAQETSASLPPQVTSIQNELPLSTPAVTLPDPGVSSDASDNPPKIEPPILSSTRPRSIPNDNQERTKDVPAEPQTVEKFPSPSIPSPATTTKNSPPTQNSTTGNIGETQNSPLRENSATGDFEATNATPNSTKPSTSSGSNSQNISKDSSNSVNTSTPVFINPDESNIGNSPSKADGGSGTGSSPVTIAFSVGGLFVVACAVGFFTYRRAIVKNRCNSDDELMAERTSKTPEFFRSTDQIEGRHSTGTVRVNSESNFDQYRNTTEDIASVRSTTSNVNFSLAASAAVSPQDIDPVEGKILICLISYDPQLDDEVALFIGDSVQIEQKFKDKWCFGTNLTTQERGVFPYACVDDDNPLSTQSLEEPSTIESNESYCVEEHQQSAFELDHDEESEQSAQVSEKKYFPRSSAINPLTFSMVAPKTVDGEIILPAGSTGFRPSHLFNFTKRLDSWAGSEFSWGGNENLNRLTKFTDA